jgi:GntR family transcriptional regulator
VTSRESRGVVTTSQQLYNGLSRQPVVELSFRSFKVGVALVVVAPQRDWRPAYVQLAETIRSKIETGVLQPGALLPSETHLADTEGLSRTTVRQAFRLLRSWGEVESQRGKGTFVRQRRARLDRWATNRYQWEKDRVHQTDDERLADGTSEQDTGRKFEDFEFHATFSEVEADADLANVFNCRKGTALLRREYRTVERATGYATGFSISHLPYKLAAKNPDLLDESKEPWPGGTHHQLSTVGVEIDRIDDFVTARLAGSNEMLLLRLEEGAVVLDIRKISTSTHGDIVEVSDICVPSESTRLRYTTQLKRWAK